MDVGKIRGLRARLRERSTSRANHIRDRRRQRDPVIGIGNHSLRDEFHLDTLKRPYCSINSDNLRRGPCSVTLVTFFSCLPIVPLPPTVHTHTHKIYICTYMCLHSSLRSSSSLSSLLGSPLFCSFASIHFPGHQFEVENINDDNSIPDTSGFNIRTPSVEIVVIL